MLEFGALCLLGFAVGAFGTLVGAGGGFILVPVLLLLYPDEDADTITAMSLLVVLANAASGSVAYAWQRRIDFHSGGWFALATLPGSLLGVVVVGYLPRRAFDALFALALATVGAYLLWPRSGTTLIRDPLRGPGIVRRMVRDREGQTFVYAYNFKQGLAISLVVGFVSSLLGIGGGIVHVPAMAVLLHFPVHIATATSHFVLAAMSLEATATHVATGSLTWSVPLARAAAIAAGAAGGAQLGARFSGRVRGATIIRALGVALILVAARLTLAALGL